MAVLPVVDSRTGIWVREIETDVEGPKRGEIVIPTLAPGGLYQNKWDFKESRWIEGLSQEDIERLKHGETPQPAGDDMEARINAKITEIWDFIL